MPSNHERVYRETIRRRIANFLLRATDPRSRYRELWSIGHDRQDEKRVGTLGAFGIDVDFDVSRNDRIVYVQSRQGKAELWRADLQ